MKKLFIKIFIICFACQIATPLYYAPEAPIQHLPLTVAIINTQQIKYAKILPNCYLYKTSSLDQDIKNIYFILPETYFVSVIKIINENVYQVQYSSFVGYCGANTISPVSFTPKDPELLNISFNINSLAGTQVWTEPSVNSGRKLTTIPAATLNIEYIASTTGEIPTGGTSNLWYYARYTPITQATKVYEGYIYSEAITNLSNIPNNLEVELITDNSGQIENTINISDTFKTILLVLICSPFAILIFVFVVKAIKKASSKKQAKRGLDNVENTNNTFTKTSYVKKRQFNNQINYHKDEPLETIEIAFPNYDYIDDDDLL